MKKILFLTTILPLKRNSGGEIVSRLIFDKLIALGYNVDILGYLRKHDNNLDIPSNMHLVKKIIIESSTSKWFTIITIFKSLLYRQGYSSQKYITKEYIQLLKKQLEKNDYSLIIIDHSQMGWLLDFIPSHIKIAFISHNVECDLYKELSQDISVNSLLRQIYKRETKKMLSLEKKLIRKSQFVWVLTNKNRERYIDFCPDCKNKLKTIVIPPIIEPIRNIEVIKKCWDIGIIGTWTWEANNKGLIWFFEEVYPQLPKNTSIRIAGKGAEWLQNRYKSVKYMGFVEDANIFMRSSKVIAIPSIAGDGVQIKSIQAISLGQQIVATSFALRGIENVPIYVTFADEPNIFAQKLIDAISSNQQNYKGLTTQWGKKRNVQFENVVLECLKKVI